MTTGLDWSGVVGDAWADEWRRTDRSFADLSRHLDAAILSAAPAGEFRALDIGCGAGGTSLALAMARIEATVVGIDLSPGLVTVAQHRAAAILQSRMSNHEAHPDAISFHIGDAPRVAQELRPFDLLYSRHGVMFFDDPVDAFAGLHAAAAPRATLIFSCFADWSDNHFASAVAQALDLPPPIAGAPGPFAFQSRDHVADILALSGWTPQSAARVPFAYRAGQGADGEDAVADALSFFHRIGPAAAALRAATPTDRTALGSSLTDVVRAHRNGNAIDFPAAAWIWSAKA